MSPRIRMPSGWCFSTPPNSWSAIASFSSSIPLIVGASERTTLSTTVGSPRNARIVFSSASEMSISSYSRCLYSMELPKRIRSNVVLRTIPAREAVARCWLFRIPLTTTRFPGITCPARSSVSRTESPCG